MWYGKEPIPEGWALCDGNNGTPNLVGSFIKASDVTDDEPTIPEGVDENNGIKLTEANIPYHTHIHKEHTHGMSALSGYTTSSGTLTSNFQWSDYNWGLSSNSTSVVSSVSGEGVDSSTTSVVSSVSASTQGGQASGGDHTHDVIINGGSIQGATSEQQEQSIDPTPVKIEPKHFKLIFIMKINRNQYQIN